MNGENHFFFVLCMAALSLFTAKHAFEVHLTPRYQAKHVNDSFEMICTVAGCSGEINFLWTTLTDHPLGAKSQTNQTVSRLVFDKLSIAHEATFICKVICGTHKESKAKIKIYSFPTDPVISRADALGLRCAIHNVYPSSRFKMEWFRGDTRISHVHVAPHDQNVPTDMFAIYTPTDEDRGKNITCRVTLDMDGVPEARAVRSVTVQYGPAFLSISAHNPVRLGERLELVCDTDRESNITWAKLGTSKAVLGTDKQLVFEHANWSHSGEYECEASAALGSRRSTVNITVQGPPNVPKIRLSQTTEPQEGDNITIFCDSDHIPSVYLTISGASLNFTDTSSPDQAYMSINIPSIQLNDSGLYHCDARNEFGSKRSSINIKVQERRSAASDLPKSIVPAVSSVSLLGAAAVLIRFLRRINKNSQNTAIDALNL